MLLTHLSAVGPEVRPAILEFGVGLTVIYGASDTGKSYIAEAIDFVLGASKLRPIRESDGYTHLQLGIQLPNEKLVTLVRPMVGETADRKIAVYPGKHLQLPMGRPDIYLAPKHNPRNTTNVSRYLLMQIGLDGKQVRLNAQNQCRLLSFRDLANLCIIDETSMQSQTPPILSGQHVSATVEKAVFKLMVDGHDDSSLVGSNQTADQRKLSKGKAELLEQLIAELRTATGQSAGLTELRRQHTRVVSSIKDLSESVGAAVQERDRIRTARDDAAIHISAGRSRLRETSDLLARFTLLREQYNSDLARLDMVREVGDLLGYFDRGVCVFCGAAVQDQHPPSGHVISEMTELAEVVNAERTKTIGLRDDLTTTLADVAAEGAELQASLQRRQEVQRELDKELATAEEALAPKNQALSELLTMRSNIERQIGTHEQIERLELRLGDFVVDDEPSESQGRVVSPNQLATLGSVIASMLIAWGIPDSTSVDFDTETYDLIVAGQRRSSRGKGIRAIFHAAYNLALATHCRAINQAHPGFLVLDSPLITYRGPEVTDAANSEDEFVSQTVAEAFFRYLSSSSDSQIVILENTDPPDGMSQATVIYFTKNHSIGRYGFFPPALRTEAGAELPRLF